MPRLVPLPPALRNRAFTPADASAFGLTDARLRGRDVQRPFHGVRALGLNLTTVLGRCRAFAVRMRSDQFFSHVTAAVLHHIPLPLVLQGSHVLHVSVHMPGNRVRTNGVICHRVSPRVAVGTVEGLRVADPVSTWCDLASVLTVDELIAAGDYLVSGRVTDAGRMSPLATIDELRRATFERAGERGSKTRNEAIGYIRTGVDSPRESKLRMLLIRSGLPEPVINEQTYDAIGKKLGTPDLKYRLPMVVLEYEGDEHRANARRFRNDIARRERFEDADWRVKRVTAFDLDVRPAEFVTEVHELLVKRGMVLPPLGQAAVRAAAAARAARL